MNIGTRMLSFRVLECSNAQIRVMHNRTGKYTRSNANTAPLTSEGPTLLLSDRATRQCSGPVNKADCKRLATAAILVLRETYRGRSAVKTNIYPRAVHDQISLWRAPTGIRVPSQGQPATARVIGGGVVV